MNKPCVYCNTPEIKAREIKGRWYGTSGLWSKQKAIELRKQGKTYFEIMKEVPVAKSTISDWLKRVGLSIAQKQNITEKRK